MSGAAVIGAGSWGTALACLLGRGGAPVRLWCRREDQASRLRSERTNESYLPGVAIPGPVRATAHLAEAVEGADIVFIAVPSHRFREVCVQLQPSVAREAILVSAAKGIEVDTLSRMTEVLAQTVAGARVAVLSGPSFAREVAEGHPTAVVAASHDADAALRVQAALSGPTFRVYAHDDVTGVEVGGAAKNVVAVAAGAVEGLGFGTNTMAALVTRGLREICRLAVALGGRERTLSGLSGLGDLVLTCTGTLSRNKAVGRRIAGGEALEDILASMTEVAEGVRTTRSVNRLASRHGVDVPIARMVQEVLHEGRPPRDAVRDLMARESKREFE